MNSVFSIQRPHGAALPLVFDSPHSGTIYPADFHYACDFDALKTAEDSFVDELFSSAPACGGTLLSAHFPRSYIDTNRAVDDIDPGILGEHIWDGPFPAQPSPRAFAGVGLIRRLVRPGMPVYDRALDTAEILHRIGQYYAPYHEALASLLREAHYNFGQVWHINCHSMPAAYAVPKNNLRLAGHAPKPSDFVLGDRDGTSCSLEFTRALRDFIEGLGYRVTVNDPFKGAALISQYASPATGMHALQIEINKALYMNEGTGEISKNFSALSNDIHKIISFCASFVENRLMSCAAD